MLNKKGGAPEESVKKAAAYDIGTTFSFSQLRSYETCPYQYKLNYVLKIPTKGSPHFSFGQSMHLTLQKFYERVQELNKARQVSLFASLEPEQSTDKYPTLEELQKLYDSCWIDDWYQSADQREEYYKKGKEIITTVYREHEKNARIPLMLEGWFKIAVGNYFLNGRIDRIDRLPDGSLEIIDYKTGQAKDKLSSEDKEQLLIYQIAAEQVPEYRHQGKTSKLTFYYLNDNVKISFLGTAEELSGLKEKLVEIIDRIRAQDFTPAPSSFICGHCDFRSICEFRAS
jgi:DNA helicase-2/ATP-dependent DNA helicase PcrA